MNVRDREHPHSLNDRKRHIASAYPRAGMGGFFASYKFPFFLLYHAIGDFELSATANGRSISVGISPTIEIGFSYILNLICELTVIWKTWRGMKRCIHILKWKGFCWNFKARWQTFYSALWGSGADPGVRSPPRCLEIKKFIMLLTVLRLLGDLISVLSTEISVDRVSNIFRSKF